MVLRCSQALAFMGEDVMGGTAKRRKAGKCVMERSGNVPEGGGSSEAVGPMTNGGRKQEPARKCGTTM